MGIIRFCLALAVVVAHSKPVFGWTGTSMVGGAAAVQMFYMISGFYMALILNRKYVGKGSYSVFLSNRILRIYPTYFAVLLITLLVSGLIWACSGKVAATLAPWVHTGHQLAPATAATLVLANLTVVGQDALLFFGIDPARGTFFPHDNLTDASLHPFEYQLAPQAWTLAVELLFYSIAPLLLRRGFRTVALVAGVGLVARVACKHLLGLGHDPWTYRFFPFELPVFLLGALAYYVYAALCSRTKLSEPAGYVAIGVMLLVIFGRPYVGERMDFGLAGLRWYYFLFAALLPLIFHATRNARHDRWIGELSYAIYICHWLVAQELKAVHEPFVEQNLGALTFILTLGLAMLLERLVERPIGRFREQRSSRASAARQESPAPA